MTQVNISADVSAKITRLPVKEGDWVEKGALLVELERGRYLAAVESSEASLRVAQANAAVTRENLTKAEKDLARTRDLHEAGLETPAQLDAAEALHEAEKARYRAALDQVEQARANLKQLNDDLSKTRIYAPMEGTISQLDKEVGEIALGSQFQEDVILVISSLSGMEAEVKVDENDVVIVSVGDDASVEVDALPDVVFRGAVTEIANTATIAGTGTTDQKTEFDVKVTITDPVTRLRPGMTATAEIVTDVREDALGVPIQAVAVRTPERLGEGNGDGGRSTWKPDKDGFVELVFVIADGTAEARQVGTGIQSDTHIEIVEGLAEGEEIVIGNYRAISRDLEDESKVVVTKEPAEKALAGAN
jgi:HlyD family secretion protein